MQNLVFPFRRGMIIAGYKTDAYRTSLVGYSPGGPKESNATK